VQEVCEVTQTGTVAGKEHEKDKGQDKRTLDVTVFAPRFPDPKQFAWDKHLTVGAAADEASASFGYAGGTPSLAKDDQVLERDKQLVAAGVRDGDTLELVDTGGGV
jgi:hypothetical protein